MFGFKPATATTTDAIAEPVTAPVEATPPPGLSFRRSFADLADRDTIPWVERDAVILDPKVKGKEVFRQNGVRVPAFWSEMATNVVASKYFAGALDSPERENSVGQLVDRVVGRIAVWGYQDGYFNSLDSADAFRLDLQALCLHQYGSFNSPVWFNVGLDDYGIVGAADGYYYDPTLLAPGQPIGATVCEDAIERPQVSACFIQSVDDNLKAILQLATDEGMLFKYGSGSGTDLSTIRSRRETLSGGGRPSGPLSFMRIYDAVAATIKSGGKTRRAAKMQTLKVSHPDIVEFIEAKGIEERKARDLEAAGWSGGMDGEAATSVLFQNSNFSVRATDRFLAFAEERRAENWFTTGVLGKSYDSGFSASAILDKTSLAAWDCGCPGMQYEDTIQRWHTCPNTAPINSSNPCSEFMFIDDSACNLSSLNLMKFRRQDGSFDADRFRAAVRVFITAQEILVDRASYPTPKIAENSHRFRPLGLGYANLGALLMVSGLPYDSDEGRDLAGAITAIMTGTAYLVSAEIAEKCGGPFDGFAANRRSMLNVMRKHEDEAKVMSRLGIWNSVELWDEARDLWSDVVRQGEKFGFRNAQATLLAPTGTIAFMMDCDTTGIEPDFALVKNKLLAGGGYLSYTNGSLREALSRFVSPGTDDQPNVDLDDAVDWIKEYGTLKGWDSAVGGGYFDSHPDAERRLAVFDCANPDPGYGRSIRPRAHLLMMAAVQPFLSGAISKTVNLPSDATVEDVREVFLDGWRLGLKAVAIYRDKSKTTQPLAGIKAPAEEANPKNMIEDAAGWYESSWKTFNKIRELLGLEAHWGDLWSAGMLDPFAETETAIAKLLARTGATRERLPDDRRSMTHKFEVDGHEGYLTVGHYPDGRPGEVFVNMAKEGSTIGGLMDSLGVALSIMLQHHVPIETICRKLAFARFEPHGRTRNEQIPRASSLADYLGRFLISRYRPDLAEEFGIIGQPPQEVLISSEAEFGSAYHPIQAVLAPPAPQSGSALQAKPLALQARPAWQSENKLCDVCGGPTVRNGTCYRCHNCGASLGCS